MKYASQAHGTYRTFGRVSTGSALWRDGAGFTAEGSCLIWLEVAKLYTLPTARGIAAVPSTPLATAIDLREVT